MKATRNKSGLKNAKGEDFYIAARVIKFVSLGFDGNWERKDFLKTSNAIQYTARPGTRIPSVSVVMHSEEGVLKTKRYGFGFNDIALVIGDVVHLPRDSKHE